MLWLWMKYFFKWTLSPNLFSEVNVVLTFQMMILKRQKMETSLDFMRNGIIRRGRMHTILHISKFYTFLKFLNFKTDIYHIAW